jgi:hypothetical protein
MKVFLPGTQVFVGTLESMGVVRPGNLPAMGVIALANSGQQLQTGIKLEVQGPETTKVYRIEVKEQDHGLARVLFYEI